VIVRPPLHAILVALLLGALCSFAVACGQDDEGLITSERASEMQDHLDAIERQVAAGKCDAVKGRLGSLRREIGELPGTVDRDLRRRLREGLETLERQAPEECVQGTETTETTTTTETVPPETTPTETVPPETTPPETVPPETTPPETTPPETTPVEPPAEPELPPESGGEEAPGNSGNTPGGGQG
jgi:hypothetical protein